jgi:hypothetical protein
MKKTKSTKRKEYEELMKVKKEERCFVAYGAAV